MSLAAIKQISELEQDLLRQREAAEAAAKKAVADAESAGCALLAIARTEAEHACAGYMAEAEQRAARETEHVTAETERACAALKAAARDKLPQAVALIIGRVVND